MAAGAVSEVAPRRGRERWSLFRGPLTPVAIYFAARLVSAAMMVALAPRQPDLSHDPTWFVSGPMPASPSYWELATNWDGQWYRYIAIHNYPPVEALGDFATQNPFAFFPLYPLLVRVVVSTTGLPFEYVAPTTSLIAGAVAVVLLHNWLKSTRGRKIALVATIALTTFPSSPAMQLAYSDSLAMVLLVPALRAAVERRWGLLVLLSLPLSLTRPLSLPLALFSLGLAIWDKERPESHWTFDRRGVTASAVVGLTTFCWPALAWLWTGRPTVYFEAAGSWVRAGGLEGGWIRGLWKVGLPTLALLMAVLIVSLIILRWRHRDDPAPGDRLGLWAGIYMLFILATTTLSASLFRHALLTLVPLGTFGPMSFVPMRPRIRSALLVAVVIIELLLQYVWIANMLVVDESPGRSWHP